MTILTTPNPHLTKTSKPITAVDKKLTNFITNLEQTLIHKKNPQGVGLSAPQIGKNIRVFCTLLDQGGKKKVRTYINPIITNQSPNFTLGGPPNKPFLEGCLSIPNILGPVYRHSWVKLEYQFLEDYQLQSRTKRFESFPARVIQHELDHLDGVLFTKRSIQQGLPLFEETQEGLREIKITQRSPS